MLQRVYNTWHNNVLLFIYHLLEERLTSDRQREIVLHSVIIVFLLIFSFAAYLVFHRFIDTTAKSVQHTAQNDFITNQDMQDMTVEEVPMQRETE